MIHRRIISFFLFVLIAIYISAQLPPQTVTFKVRKPQKKAVVQVIEAAEPAFVIVEENATFQGGDIDSFRKWVQSNMVYPTAAVEAGIQGKVIMQFAVNSNGNLVDTKILRGVNPELDKEALRAVLSSPKWVAGRQGGKAVKQQFVIPIVFQLQ